MSSRNERISRVDHVMESINSRMSLPSSDKRMDQLLKTFMRLEWMKIGIKLEVLKDKKVLIIDSPWITDNLPNYVERSGIKVEAQDTSLLKHLDQFLIEGEFDGALIHMVSTSSDDDLRTMSNRILKAGSETNTKIVVMYGNYHAVRQDVSLLFQLFDATHIGYVPKWSEGVKDGFLKLADMFDES